MRYFLKKWWPLIAEVCIALLIALFAIGEFPLKTSLIRKGDQLAQIIATETGILRKWQQRGALRQSLVFGSHGKDVALLQGMLSQDPGIYPERKVTGHFGDATARAVVRFQGEYGLPQTGIMDSATRQILNGIFVSFLCPKPVTAYPEWLMRKVTPESPLPSDYVPPALANIAGNVRTAGIICLRADVTVPLMRMFADAQREGVVFMVNSGYRKPEIQKYLYDFWVQAEGDKALHEIARPGLSEHQLGSTVDLTDASIGFAGTDDRFASSAGGLWLQQHAHEYGFVMSYPEGKEESSGFKYEPWHWRYVGIQAATRLRESGLTYNESDLDDVSPLAALRL